MIFQISVLPRYIAFFFFSNFGPGADFPNPSAVRVWDCLQFPSLAQQRNSTIQVDTILLVSSNTPSPLSSQFCCLQCMSTSLFSSSHVTNRSKSVITRNVLFLKCNTRHKKAMQKVLFFGKLNLYKIILFVSRLNFLKRII